MLAQLAAAFSEDFVGSLDVVISVFLAGWPPSVPCLEVMSLIGVSSGD